MSTFDKAWSLWPTLREMSCALSSSYSMLHKRRSRGLLPPAELDLRLIKRAAESGVDLKLEDIAAAREAAASDDQAAA